MASSSRNGHQLLLQELYSNYGFFTQWSLPEILVSYNDPQLVLAEFEIFFKKNGFGRTRLAPFHPNINGEAKRFVQTQSRKQ